MSEKTVAAMVGLFLASVILYVRAWLQGQEADRNAAEDARRKLEVAKSKEACVGDAARKEESVIVEQADLEFKGATTNGRDAMVESMLEKAKVLK